MPQIYSCLQFIFPLYGFVFVQLQWHRQWRREQLNSWWVIICAIFRLFTTPFCTHTHTHPHTQSHIFATRTYFVTRFVRAQLFSSSYCCKNKNTMMMRCYRIKGECTRPLTHLWNLLLLLSSSCWLPLFQQRLRRAHPLPSAIRLHPLIRIRPYEWERLPIVEQKDKGNCTFQRTPWLLSKCRRMSVCGDNAPSLHAPEGDGNHN